MTGTKQAPTLLDELEALRRLVQRAGLPGGAAGAVEVLRQFSHLQPWADPIADQLEQVTQLSPAEALAIAKEVRAEIDGTQAEALLEGSADPAKAETVLARMREAFMDTRKEAAIKAAEEAAQEARNKKADPMEAMEAALRKEAAKIRRDEVPPLDDVWEGAKKREADAWAGRSGFKLNPKFGGSLADWMNNWAGPAGVFTAGRTVLIGAASSGGKTTLGNVFACSAMAAGLPVLYWQAELSTEEHLADLARCWNDNTRGRQISGPIPGVFPNLLEYPRRGDGLRKLDKLKEEVNAWADRMELKRKPGANECRGVVVLDYLQLMEDPTSRSDFKATEAAASTLAQIAAERNLVAVILSQASKGAQKELKDARAKIAAMKAGKEKDAKKLEAKKLEAKKRDAMAWEWRNFAELCFAGADVRRVAHSAFGVVIDGKEGGDIIRVMVNSKNRGCKDAATPDLHKWIMTASGRTDGTSKNATWDEDPNSAEAWRKSDENAKDDGKSDEEEGADLDA